MATVAPVSEQAGFAPEAFHGLRAFRLFDSCDVDETRQRISEVMQPHVLQPSSETRRHRGTMEYFQLGRIGIGTIRFGRMFVDVRELADYHLLVFSAQGRARVNVGGTERIICGPRGVCIRPGERFRADFSEDCRQLVLRIDARAMNEHLETAGLCLAEDVDLSGARLGGWANILSALTSSQDTLRMIHDLPRVATHYETLLLALLTAGQAEPRPRVRRHAASVGVKRAEAFMRENMAEQVSLPQVATAAGMSVRALLENFRSCRGQTPMRTLRDLRLDHVRDRLALDPDRTITEIATDAGFTHLSRFAKQYCDRFGEPPSARRRGRRA